MSADWIEHTRGDGELLGWMRPDGNGFVPIDRLGRELGPATDWLSAEEVLDERGLSWLADLWQLQLDDGRTVRVRLVEVAPHRVVAAIDDFGSVDVPQQRFVLPFPAPDTLTPLDRSSALGTTLTPEAG